MIKVLSLVNEALIRVGKKTDAASATGSLHAKMGDIKNNLTFRPVFVSDELQVSADAQATTASSEYVLVKEIIMYVSGKIRVSFELANGSSPTGFAKACVYKNGIKVGIERSQSSGTFITYSEDLAVSIGDIIQIYAMTASGLAKVKNFRVHYSHPTQESKVTVD